MHMRKLANAIFLAVLLSSSAYAQTNAGLQKPDPELPFTVTQVATFDLPWRIAFLPDGRMLVTEKVGRLNLVTPQGTKTEVPGIPPSYFQGQNGMLGVFLSPHYATDGKTCVARVKLEPDRTYAFWLNSDNFQNFKDADGRPAVPYLLIFQTKHK